jgi:hypothetical protein
VSVPVAIVGAGPYGLSLSAHLSALGVQHRIVGRPMATWEAHMPRGMFLKSEGCASNIDEPGGRSTLRGFCEQEGLAYSDAGWPVPVETFAAYGRWFQRRLVPHVEQDEVTAISGDDDGFSITMASGTRLTSPRVVVASGITDFAHTAPELRSLPPDRVSHTSSHANFARFRGRRVAVVGAGQSALETATLLAEAGARPELIARAIVLNWNPDPALSGYYEPRRWRLRPTPLGAGWRLWTYWNAMAAYHLLPERFRVRHVKRTLGPAGGWWLRSRFADAVPVRLGQTLLGARADADGVVLCLAAGRETVELAVDDVIAGTGYRVDLDRVEFLSPQLRGRIRSAAGVPVLSSWSESSVRGLYFTGLAAANTFGPAMRFVCGTGFAGPRVARHIAASTASGR